MTILTDNAKAARYESGHIIVSMERGIRFPALNNPRLAPGNDNRLNPIEISPFGRHWPDLEEGLSFKGILAGNYGQPRPVNPPTGEAKQTGEWGGQTLGECLPPL